MEKEWEIEAETDEVEFESYDTIESEGDNDGLNEYGDFCVDDKDDWS